jgi:LDH2 family malate/lactate/ureidoglycolate dehydrogenase
MSCGGVTPAYRVEELLGFATALLRRAGLDADKAGTVAAVLVEGDLLGHTTHGLALAAPYLARTTGRHLYPGIMDALAPWAKRFEVVPPAPTH